MCLQNLHITQKHNDNSNNNNNINGNNTKAAKQTKLLTSKEEDKERIKKTFLIYFIRKKVEKHLQDISEN